MSTKWSKRELGDIRQAAWCVAYASVPGGWDDETQDAREGLRRGPYGKRLVLAGLAHNIRMSDARVRSEDGFVAWLSSPEGFAAYPISLFRFELLARAIRSKKDSVRRRKRAEMLCAKVHDSPDDEILQLLQES